MILKVWSQLDKFLIVNFNYVFLTSYILLLNKIFDQRKNTKCADKRLQFVWWILISSYGLIWLKNSYKKYNKLC